MWKSSLPKTVERTLPQAINKQDSMYNKIKDLSVYQLSCMLCRLQPSCFNCPALKYCGERGVKRKNGFIQLLESGEDIDKLFDRTLE